MPKNAFIKNCNLRRPSMISSVQNFFPDPSPIFSLGGNSLASRSIQVIGSSSASQQAHVVTGIFQRAIVPTLAHGPMAQSAYGYLASRVGTFVWQNIVVTASAKLVDTCAGLCNVFHQHPTERNPLWGLLGFECVDPSAGLPYIEWKEKYQERLIRNCSYSKEIQVLMLKNPRCLRDFFTGLPIVNPVTLPERLVRENSFRHFTEQRIYFERENIRLCLSNRPFFPLQRPGIPPIVWKEDEIEEDVLASRNQEDCYRQAKAELEQERRGM